VSTAVRQERTGWRDEALSLRHREWGWDCPALDLDFILIEYDTGEPVARVEYKHEAARPVNVTHPSYRALAILGERADLPVFLVRYAGDFSWWDVQALNTVAALILPEPRHVAETQYIRFLHWLRGRKWDADTAAQSARRN
jgi:hypothetical protein